MKATMLRSCVLLVTLLVPAPLALAQTPRASVRGIVVDQTGGRLPGAQVRVTEVATNTTRSTTTDGEGRFTLAELPAGRYTIEAELTGFSVFRRLAQLTVGQEVWLEAQLHVTTTIDIADVGDYPMVNADSVALSTTLDQRQIANLPLDGRNFLELALLTPGTAPAPQGSASSVRGDFAFTANGAREDFNNYLLDGVYNVDPKLNTVAVRPSVDAIQEFEVASSTYDASYGRNAGAQVNVITRSGANRCYGTLYEFFRNAALDSRNYFAPANEPDPDYNRHQFGGSIGGPVTRNRVFFFGNYEGTRLREGLTRVTTVPTLAERGGDFSQSARQPFNFLTGQPFPGGQIPSFFQHPVGAAIAALYPEPNRSGPVGNFVSSPRQQDDVDQFDTRIDAGLTDVSRLTARYSFNDRRLLEPFAGPAFAAVPGYGNAVARRGQNLAVTHVHVLGPKLLNDLRFGYNRVAIGVFAENAAVTNQTIGLPALSTNPRDAGLSFISVAGYSPLGHEYNNPQESAADTYQVSDTVTWAGGSHLLKLGADWYGVRQSAYRDVQARGFLTFVDQGYTGNALADLLLGLPVVTGGARLDNPQHLRAQSWSAYLHDDWRATDALTISAGLRYDYASPPVDADDRANLYDVATGAVLPVGTGGIPRGGFTPDRNNLAPRAGFAWTVDKASMTVFRGGYGIYYNQGALATSEGLYFNPPYFNLGVYFPAPGLPPLTLSDPFPSSFPVFVPQSATAYQRDLQTPWMQHWNVNLQREIGGARAFEVAYVGSRGHDLLSARDVNQPAASAARPNLRPNPLFADVTLIESRASSRYHALQLKFQQRALNGLSMLASYTFGRSTDDASGFFTSAGDPNFPQNSVDPGAERGRSSFDVRQRFSLSLSYALPFDGNVWLENWELQSIVTLQSGRPFTVAMHPDIDVSNTGRSNLGFGNNDRPNLSGDPARSDPGPEQWFNTAAFTMPAFGTFGSAGRNILDGPGYANVNLALVKSVGIRIARLQLRAEAFNLLNRANFDLPDAFLGSPTFGRILSAQSPRRIQFGVKALF